MFHQHSGTSNHGYCNYDVERKIKENEYMYDYLQIPKIRGCRANAELSNILVMRAIASHGMYEFKYTIPAQL
jgi:hypothetical protein